MPWITELLAWLCNSKLTAINCAVFSALTIQLFAAVKGLQFVISLRPLFINQTSNISYPKNSFRFHSFSLHIFAYAWQASRGAVKIFEPLCAFICSINLFLTLIRLGDALSGEGSCAAKQRCAAGGINSFHWKKKRLQEVRSSDAQVDDAARALSHFLEQDKFWR